jgi:hypothetical protein
VYLFVPGKGVVALDKVTGKFNRDPLWLVESGAAPLAEGAQFVYVRDTDNRVLAVRRQGGAVAFKTERADLRHFTAPPEADVVFGATDDGKVFGIKPVTSGGITGQLVSAPGRVDLGG